MTVIAIMMPNHMGSNPSLRGRVKDRRRKDHEGEVVDEGAAQR